MLFQARAREPRSAEEADGGETASQEGADAPARQGTDLLQAAGRLHAGRLRARHAGGGQQQPQEVEKTA